MNDTPSQQRIHIIPIGHPEPIHRSSLGCWCHPSPKDSGQIAIGETTGLLIAMTRDELAAVKYLPMYRRVAVRATDAAIKE